jgi:hypothetical protein
MRKTLSKAVVFAAAGFFGFASVANANHLTAPTGLVCPIVSSVIETNWDDLTDANKYSVNVVATYDTGVVGDATDDTTVDFDFSADVSQLSIPLSALKHDFVDATGAIVSLDPIDVQLRVKGLHPGRDQGRQDNPFSAFCIPA